MIDAVELRGVRLRLHPEGEGVSDGIRRSGDFYEAAILDYVRNRHLGQRVIVDAGANVGNHTAYFARFLAHDRIHAFEPIAANYALLCENVAAFATVTTHQVALSDGPRVLRMEPNPANMGACLVTDEGSLEVDAVALDSLGLSNVTLVKVDVENHEATLLLGAAETIARDHPLILIEDWTYGGIAEMLPGYEMEMAWPDAFTYLYRWAS
jgi:FkbM family methyltransferase